MNTSAAWDKCHYVMKVPKLFWSSLFVMRKDYFYFSLVHWCSVSFSVGGCLINSLFNVYFTLVLYPAGDILKELYIFFSIIGFFPYFSLWKISPSINYFKVSVFLKFFLFALVWVFLLLFLNSLHSLLTLLSPLPPCFSLWGWVFNKLLLRGGHLLSDILLQMLVLLGCIT